MDTIGDRVRARIKESGQTSAQLATAIGMGATQLSKSLLGRRQFSAVELAQIADVLETSLHWLVTGDPDPMEVRIAARHRFNGDDRTYSPEGAGADQETLRDISLLYLQAYQ